MRVLVTDPIADAGLDRLRDAGHEVTTAYDATGDALLDAVSDAHALIVRSGTAVTDAVFEAAPDLVIVARAGIGVDNIDIDAATDHGVMVANAPAGNVRAAAEHTVALAFAAARSIPQAHARLDAGSWAKDDYLGTELSGKTLGVVGLGRVGQEVATRLDSLGMDLVAYDPYIGEDRAAQLGAELVDIETCVARADFLTIHVPLTDETDGLIGEAELARMDGGYVINVARGGVVDEDALADAAQDGVIAGAALDVFRTEPLPAASPLHDADSIITTPHLGASTKAAQENVATDTADQVVAALAGDPVVNALNAPSAERSAFDRIRPFVDLAETAGTVAAALFDPRIERVDVTYQGEVADEDVALVTAAAQQGAFAGLEWQVNAVNAPRVAEERGIAVTETKNHRSEAYQSLVSVTVGNGDAELTVSGTLFAGDDPRLVEIDGFRVEAAPNGHMLVARNHDTPGVIGFIGGVLGTAEVNIAGMFNAREARGGEALTVYNLDADVPARALDELAGDDRIVDVTSIELNGE
ncbi:phosphoglycerate dehydrogenase [Halobacterium salinarum]|uniref:D-3-phosphoglycerate dehydrogenase n=4 Tax=Halobacterium salinarum TaxID=2242 RepID=Q9HMR0_HALSA|nr:phosphoglycerate dehydrogenase [Halobacterium salinarum]AAG20511.1 phosphoglycerate dehydrogenase [Halobacterium salinarum NRC-1]MBB6089558.1 D-3-phosphoglycerate dehydrogenase [Halobacterium salinarum]MDL0118443.1 phosphoglycerate dehydrogenase [Halobacterium salinarum]MDL0124282.1 phosphoglycerate dehydrogenase [Halobacterium salinarum]MDL0131685.1 phosphoglycerate dehydrogenase [Halobacterium salinarum]